MVKERKEKRSRDKNQESGYNKDTKGAVCDDQYLSRLVVKQTTARVGEL